MKRIHSISTLCYDSYACPLFCADDNFTRLRAVAVYYVQENLLLFFSVYFEVKTLPAIFPALPEPFHIGYPSFKEC